MNELNYCDMCDQSTDHPLPGCPGKPASSLSTPTAHNRLTLKWGTLKGWDVKTPEAMALLKAYHDEPVSFSVMMQHDTPSQKETLVKLIDLCNEIWLDWEGKKVSRDEAKEYLRTYGQEAKPMDNVSLAAR